MMLNLRRWVRAILFFTLLGVPLFSQEVLRGQVRIDLEPVYAQYADIPYPLDTTTAHRRALEEASIAFSGMIYGWAFEYDIGERVRKIEERFSLENLGQINFGDPRLIATDTDTRDMRFYLWVDYHTDEIQSRRLKTWKTSGIIETKGEGDGPLAGPPEPDAWQDAWQDAWMEGKQAALEDAARGAIRHLLQGSQRNRPKSCTGYIALCAFPTYHIVAGAWHASARFMVEIVDIMPFPAY